MDSKARPGKQRPIQEGRLSSESENHTGGLRSISHDSFLIHM